MRVGNEASACVWHTEWSSVASSRVALCVVSEAPKAGPAPKKYQSYDPRIKTDEEKKEELMAAMITKMGDKDEQPLPQVWPCLASSKPAYFTVSCIQVAVDGVDSDEWSD